MKHILSHLRNRGHEKHKISPLEAKHLLKEKNVILIDVRTKEEYAFKRIKGASLLQVTEIELLVKELYPDQKLTYILYCRSGIRSGYAQRIMLQMGYEHVLDLGGIIDWPYETEKD